MSQFIREAELHHAWANWLDMCKGTEVDVNSGWRLVDFIFIYYKHKPRFNGPPTDYKIAIGIVEGKPVFIGDKLYNHNGGKILASARGFNWYDKEAFSTWLKSLSWNPPKPKPKTAMVEILVEDIEKLATCDGFYKFENRLYEACRKTLENLKCPT